MPSPRFACVAFMLFALAGAHVFAQASNQLPDSQACGQACPRERLDRVFAQAIKDDLAQRPAPSATRECAPYGGQDAADPLLDVCAKLKYVRSLPAGTRTHFACPFESSVFVGQDVARIRSLWGEPDYKDEPPERTQAGFRWIYVIGSPVPLAFGGGFPELSLDFDDAGVVHRASCAYSR